MKPSDFLSTMPKPGICVDCNGEATLLDRKDPLCARCARVLGVTALSSTDMLDMATCSHCSYSYNAHEHDRCPNGDCIINRSVYDTLADDGDEPLDPEHYYDDFDRFSEPDDGFDLEDEDGM